MPQLVSIAVVPLTTSTVRIKRGTPGELHALDPFSPDAPSAEQVERSLWICEADTSGLVLGSRQSIDLVDAEACRRAGLEVASRRSGGGAVLIVPGDVVWIDLVAPAGDLPDDVRASMVLVGECWLHALADQFGPAPDGRQLTVHRGGMVPSAWSSLVCFAGLGPGEVLWGDRKLVGLSQRRTRRGVRVQGLLHRRSNVGAMRNWFTGDLPADVLHEPACLPAVDTAVLAARLAAQLTERLG